MDVYGTITLSAFALLVVSGGYMSYKLATKYRRGKLKFVLAGISICVLIFVLNFLLFVAIEIDVIDKLFRFDGASNTIRNFAMVATMVFSIFASGILILRYFSRNFKKFDIDVIESIGSEDND